MSRRSQRKRPKPELTPEALKRVAQRFRVLGEPTRLQIIQVLFDGELTVQEIIDRTGTGQANASKHLSILAGEGILARRKEGLFVHYRIADESIYELCELVCGALSARFERAHADFGGAR